MRRLGTRVDRCAVASPLTGLIRLAEESWRHPSCSKNDGDKHRPRAGSAELRPAAITRPTRARHVGACLFKEQRECESGESVGRRWAGASAIGPREAWVLAKRCYSRLPVSYKCRMWVSSLRYRQPHLPPAAATITFFSL